jgi:hypothetical protein
MKYDEICAALKEIDLPAGQGYEVHIHLVNGMTFTGAYYAPKAGTIRLDRRSGRDEPAPVWIDYHSIVAIERVLS